MFQAAGRRLNNAAAIVTTASRKSASASAHVPASAVEDLRHVDLFGLGADEGTIEVAGHVQHERVGPGDDLEVLQMLVLDPGGHVAPT